MPKLKSRKGVLKRMRLTRRGKVVFHGAGRRHLMSTKSGNRRRAMRRKRSLKACDAKRYVWILKR
jgi:large subunit ribosomal protein L35